MKRRNLAAFMLSELVVSTAVAATVLVVLFTLLNTATVLSVTNVSINETHFAVRRSIDKVLAKVGAAAGAPELVDAVGASVSGNGPAAGIRCLVPASPQAYPVSAAVTASAMSLVAVVGGQPAPKVGDVILMTDLGFRGTVASVSASGGNQTITFTSTAGSCFNPVKATGTVIPAGSKFFLFNPTAFISVNNALRYYPRARSVAADGATVFNDAANYVMIATLVPLNGAAGSVPFQYLDAGRRSIDVNLRINAPAYGNRVGNFDKFLSVRTTAAVRSVSL